jgi:hypothetical protein
LRGPIGPLISVSTVMDILVPSRDWWNITNTNMQCSWCEKISRNRLCRRCEIIESHAIELGKQVALLIPIGGVQIYLGIERTGQKTELLSVKRWSPLEPLENVESAATPLPTFKPCQE